METDKLKPCPFCGGEAEIQIGEYTSFIDGYAVRCGNCSLTFGANGRIGETYCWSCRFESESEAIEAWNTRAERTCTIKHWNNASGVAFTRGECSECGGYLLENSVTYEPRPYCPNCGAKVVQE